MVLAASSPNATAKELIRYYANRWGIECGFRDTKDLRYGMGMDSVRVNSPKRPDQNALLT